MNFENSIAWSNLAVALWGTGKRQEALQAHGIAFVLNPENDTIITNLANSLSAMKDRQALEGLYQKIIESNLNHPEAFNDLGVAFYNIGDTSAAKRAYRKALEIDPSNKLARKNLTGLEANKAMNAVGGIDLNEDLLDMRIKRDGKGFPLAVKQQDLEAFNILGLAPIIMRIIPFNPASIH